MHPNHRPGAKNPKLTEGELRAVLHALDLVNTETSDEAGENARPRYRGAFEEHEWRALQRGAAKLAGSLPARSGR